MIFIFPFLNPNAKQTFSFYTLRAGKCERFLLLLIQIQIRNQYRYVFLINTNIYLVK